MPAALSFAVVGWFGGLGLLAAEARLVTSHTALKSRLGRRLVFKVPVIVLRLVLLNSLAIVEPAGIGLMRFRVVGLRRALFGLFFIARAGVGNFLLERVMNVPVGLGILASMVKLGGRFTRLCCWGGLALGGKIITDDIEHGVVGFCLVVLAYEGLDTEELGQFVLRHGDFGASIFGHEHLIGLVEAILLEELAD